MTFFLSLIACAVCADSIINFVKRKGKKRRYHLADLGNGKKVRIRVIEHLTHDPEWEKVEEALARAAYRNLPEPPEG